MKEITKQAEEMAKENNLNEEINQAYIDNVGVEYAKAEDVEEAYAGDFDDNKAFAFDIAENTGFEEPGSWPYNCIDWERAARDLMYDYFKVDGHYFRNL